MIVSERWTIADLVRFPDNDDLRYEIINGDLHVSKAPNWYHQLVADRIARVLGNWNAVTAGGEVASTPGIILDDEDNLIPDVIWISHERLALALGQDGKLHEMPELVIEVLSPGIANTRRDRELKPDVYARRGVAEYWIADWQQHTLDVYRSDGTELHPVATLIAGDTRTTPLLIGFTLEVAMLFAGVPRTAP
jgi:Uma2 family endonuclease